MPSHPLPLTKVIHEALATVICFSLSREKTEAMLSDTFQGEWRHLRTVVYDIAEEQATKAAIELALFLRILDDHEKMTAKGWGGIENCGVQFKRSGSVCGLSPRQAANKIIHAKSYHWKENPRDDVKVGPVLTCFGHDTEDWERAEIEVFSIAAVCGLMAS